jgi:hypothetical protein
MVPKLTSVRQTKDPNQKHQYNVRASFERIITDIAGPYRKSERGNQYLLFAMDYFTK